MKNLPFCQVCEHKNTHCEEWKAWLVEDGANGWYRTMMQGMIGWTADPYKALHFCRRDDAERFAEEDPDAWKITEHQFQGPMKPEPKDTTWAPKDAGWTCPACNHSFKKCIHPDRECHHRTTFTICHYMADTCVSDEPEV